MISRRATEWYSRTEPKCLVGTRAINISSNIRAARFILVVLKFTLIYHAIQCPYSINRGCGAGLDSPSSGAHEPEHSRTLELIRNSYLSPTFPILTSDYASRKLLTRGTEGKIRNIREKSQVLPKLTFVSDRKIQYCEVIYCPFDPMPFHGM